MLVRVPVAGAGTSMFTLSVTTSTSGSYFSTLSPTCFSHFPITPSVTDSPTCGSSILMAVSYSSPVCLTVLRQGLS